MDSAFFVFGIALERSVQSPTYSPTIWIQRGLLAAMLQLVVGMSLAVLVCDWREQVTRGFLGLTSSTALVIAIVSIPVGTDVWYRKDSWELSGLLLQGGLVSGLLAYTVLLVRGNRLRRLVGAISVLFGLVALTLLVELASRPSIFARPLPPLMTLVASIASAVALGTATAGLLLGHWYLVTPRLSSRPLRLLCDLLLISLVPLTALAGWYVWRYGVAGFDAPVLWLGAGMITVFPAAVTLAARACCVDGPGRGRSLQAATGLLYIVAACVLAGGLAGNAVLLVG